MADDVRTQRADWELEDAYYLEQERKFRRALLAERYGPLPVERTRPIAKVIPRNREPEPQTIRTRVVFVNDHRSAPWRSHRNQVDADGWDPRAA